MANREKLQPQRKIMKKGYSPKERKERAGNGMELLVGLGAGTASSPSMSPWSSPLTSLQSSALTSPQSSTPTSPCEGLASGRDLQPLPALQSCGSFSITPKGGMLWISMVTLTHSWFCCPFCPWGLQSGCAVDEAHGLPWRGCRKPLMGGLLWSPWSSSTPGNV